jgi:STE24 endopeptidase
LLGLSLLGALAAAWAYAAHELWQTSVPGDLKLPEVDMSTIAGAGELHSAQHFSFVLGLLGLIGLVLPLIVLAVYAKWGHRFIGESAAGPIGTGMLLAMLGLALVWISMTAPGLIELWWVRKHGNTEMGYVDWLITSWFGLIPEFELICLTILIVVGFARLIGDRWWLAAGPAFAAAFLFVSFVAPYEIEPALSTLHRPQLVRAEKRLAAREGVKAVPMRVMDAGTDTTAPNAFAMGVGPSRRVVFWSTMLDGRFSEAEVETVLAHELAHHKHDHILKGIAWMGLLVLPLGFVIAVITRRRGGMRVVTVVPLFLFLWILGQTALIPLENTISRRMEAEADWTALQATRDPKADEALFAGFFHIMRDDPDPPGWYQAFFGGHPSFEQRIAMARAWQARRASS